MSEASTQAQTAGSRGMAVLGGALLLLVASWAAQLAAGRFFLCIDGVSRLLFAVDYVSHPQFLPHYYWLPLPFWWQGTFLLLPGGYRPWVWSLAALLPVLAAAAMLGAPGGGGGRERISALCLFLSAPVVWALTTTGLSEPLVLLGMAALVRLHGALVRRFRPAVFWGVIAALAVLIASRYEGWMAAAVYGPLLGVHLARGNRKAQRWAGHYAAGMVGLAALCVGWLAAQQWLMGDWRAPFQEAAGSALDHSLPRRLGMAAWWMFAQAPVCMVLGVSAAVAMARRPQQWALLLPFLCVLIPYWLMAAFNMIGSVYPQRFALPLLAPAAVLAAEGALGPAMARWPQWRKPAIAALGALAVLAMIPGLAREPFVDLAYRDAGKVLGPQASPTHRVLLLDSNPTELTAMLVLMPRGAVVGYDGEAPLSQALLRRERIEKVLFRDEARLEALGVKIDRARPLEKTYRWANVVLEDRAYPQPAVAATAPPAPWMPPAPRMIWEWVRQGRP